MERILITGGAGFIGSHLCSEFIKKGSSVICVDNFSSGSRENLKNLISNPDFTLIEQDVCQPLTIKKELSAIFHFASLASPNPASPVAYVNHPVATMLANSLGTRNMLELATHHNCQIILASTSEIYGDPSIHPQSESYWGNVSSTGVRSCYDEGKRFLEALSFAYYRQEKTKIKVARIFNTYGPGMRLDDGRLIPELINSLLKKAPFKLYGDGSSSRSFCYIDDLVAGLLSMYHHEVVGEVINLGNPREYTVAKVVKLAENATGQKIDITRLPALPDDPLRRRPDITKAKTLLTWEPKVGFEQGLIQMLKFYQ